VTHVNVTELRQNLPSWLALVQRGRRIRVTSRGRVIAEIAPPAAEPAEVEGARALLRGSIGRYERPLEPADAAGAWDAER
jgi:antitoxin (DNA-binding transcriptional repressor) of toxin-antitoxin stability system